MKWNRKKIEILMAIGILLFSGLVGITSLPQSHASSGVSIGNWGGLYSASLTEMDIGTHGQLYDYGNLLYVFNAGGTQGNVEVINATTGTEIISGSLFASTLQNQSYTSNGVDPTYQFLGVFNESIYYYSLTPIWNVSFKPYYYGGGWVQLGYNNITEFQIAIHRYNYLTLLPESTAYYNLTTIIPLAYVMTDVGSSFINYGQNLIFLSASKANSYGLTNMNYDEGLYNGPPWPIIFEQGPTIDGISMLNFVTGQWHNVTGSGIMGYQTMTSIYSASNFFGTRTYKNIYFFGSPFINYEGTITANDSDLSGYFVSSFQAFGNINSPSVEVTVTPITVFETLDSTTMPYTISLSSSVGYIFNPMKGTYYVPTFTNGNYSSNNINFDSSIEQYIGGDNFTNTVHTHWPELGFNQIPTSSGVIISDFNYSYEINGASGTVQKFHNPINYGKFSLPSSYAITNYASNGYITIFNVDSTSLGPYGTSGKAPSWATNYIYFMGNNQPFPSKSVNFTQMSGFTFASNNNMTLYMSGTNNELYIVHFTFVPVSLKINSNIPIPANITIGNTIGNFSSKAPLSISVLPSIYSLNISAPKGYVIGNISVSGTGVSSLSKYRQFEFFHNASFSLNISEDPTVSVIFVPYTYNVTFNSNINLGVTWLTEHNLEKNVTWYVNITHGTDPTALIIKNNSLPSQDVNATNYTLEYSSNTQNLTFHLMNGSYKYSVSVESLFIASPENGNITVSGANQAINITFSDNYPKAVISFVPSKIPIDTAWVLSAQNSNPGANGVTIKSYSWAITGPVDYTLTGENPVIYFNATGNYTINLKVTNSVGLSNSTSVNTEIVKFSKNTSISMNIVLQGTFTNSSAEYAIYVTVNKNISVTSLEAIIDNTSSMNVRYVSMSTNNTTKLSTYEYIATFTPSSYELGTHYLNFSAYDSLGQYNYKAFTKQFGSVKTAPFNLMGFFGGPTNFWAMVASLIGVIITIATLKVSRTSDVIIEANGHESILKAKPVKGKIKKGGNKR